MDSKQFILMSGLPRTGSTLLGNILAQNSSIYFGGNSPVCELAYRTQQMVDVHAREWLLMSSRYEDFSKSAPKKMVSHYYEGQDQSIIFDKCRTWCCPENREIAKSLFRSDTKFLILVRPIDEIVQSFVSLRKKNGWNGDLFSDLLVEGSDPILWPFNGVIYSKFMNFKNTMFISYADIIYNTKKVVDDICQFVGLPKYEYSFTNIEEKVTHNDDFLDLKGLHEIRLEISERKHDIKIPKDIKDKCQEYNNRMIDMGIQLGRTI